MPSDDIVCSGKVAVERGQWGEFWALGLNAEEINRFHEWQSIVGTERDYYDDPPIREFYIRDMPHEKVQALWGVCVVPPSLEMSIRG